MLKHLARLFGSQQPQDSPETPPDSTAALPVADIELIVPMIKAVSDSAPKDRVTEIHLSFEQSPASLPFAADMIVMYAIDRPDHLEYLSNEVAAATGFTAEKLHDAAVKNLPSRLGKVQLHDCGEGVFGLSAGGTFEASLLLLDDLWHQLAERLPGEPLAAVPSRDLLFVVGSARPNANDLIASRARIELAEKRYAISQSVLVRRGGKWLAHAN
jgi:uncharacterized protein YtpQ (UPF0354 family)